MSEPTDTIYEGRDAPDGETLIMIEPMKDARSRDHYEGLKAKASDVHNWPNRLEL
jgi:hypothetical protein